MMWVELGLLVLLLAGSIIVGRALGRSGRTENTDMKREEIDQLLALTAGLQDEIKGLRRRIVVLEKLATDEEDRLAQEIERLRRARGQDGSDSRPPA